MIRSFIIVVGLQHFASAAEAPATAAAAPKKPNIVIIMSDDGGYGDLSCNGAPRYKTPALDMRAASGINFHAASASFRQNTPTGSPSIEFLHRHSNLK